MIAVLGRRRSWLKSATRYTRAEEVEIQSYALAFHQLAAFESSQRSTSRSAPNNASASAAALGVRAAGSFARQARTTLSSDAGMGRSVFEDGGAGFSSMCFTSNRIGLSASNTSRPVSRKNATQPNA